MGPFFHIRAPAEPVVKQDKADRPVGAGFAPLAVNRLRTDL
jgi:hypothetical protein